MTSKKSVNNTKSREQTKKVYRLTIRRLPTDFTAQEFSNHVQSVCDKLAISAENYTIEHFLEGKSSRKRGAVYSAGYVSFRDEQDFNSILKNCPSVVPFLSSEYEVQPIVSRSLSQKAFKQKERPDKYLNTYEVDPEFVAFKAMLEQPQEKLQSAEIQYDKKTNTETVIDFSQNPLLKYMREKAMKKIEEKKLLKKKILKKSGSSNAAGASVSCKSKEKDAKVIRIKKRSTASEETDTDKKSSKRKEKDKDGKSRSRKDKPSSDSKEGTGSESGSGQNCGISRGRVKHGDKPFPSDSPMAGSILKVLKRNPDGGSAARASTSGNAAEKAESSTKVSETKNAERTDKPARSEKPRYRKPKEGKKDASSAGANNG